MPPSPAPDDTFCIAVIGDFMGGAPVDPGSAGVDWTPRRATPDTIMRLTGLSPRLRVPSEEGGTEEVSFSSMDDFDPRTLFQNLRLFESFRVAREVAERGTLPGAARTNASGPPPGDASRSPGLLDAILEASHPSTASTGPIPNREELDAFVRDAVRPHLVADDTDAKARIAAVDRAASQALSRLVHSPSFQRLESIWRSVVFLLSRIDTSGKVRVYLVHLPQEVLSEDLSAAPDPTRSRLHALLSAPDLGAPGRRWAVAVGAFELGLNGDDLHFLRKIAFVAGSARTPWLSGVRPFPAEPGTSPSAGDMTAVDPDPPEDWHAFRTRPEAAWLGLTFPRFLLREPEKEGRRRAGTPVYREEAASWADLLWGHGPFPVAALMAQGFAAEGRDFRPERHLELGGVPMAAPDGQEDARPRATEVPLSPERALHLMEMGIIPLVEIPQRAALRVAGLPAVGVGRPFLPRER